MDRRTFLRLANTAAATGLGGALFGCAGRSPATTRDLPSLDRIGLQLSTIRELITRDLDAAFRLVADVGYRMVETSADLYDKGMAEELRTVLDRYGLRAATGMYRYDALLEDLPGVLRATDILGQEYVCIPSLPDAYRENREAYEEAARQFNTLGRRIRAGGRRLAYHNHGFEFETLGGDSPAFDILLEQTDPELVTFELDLYWINKADHDPIAYIERFPGRFELFHLKDSTAAPEKDFAPVGEGVLDFREILSRSEQAGMRYGFVEHDRPADPAQSIRTSYATLSRMLP